jgi:hypothetical protein
MRRIGATAVLVLASVMPAISGDIPARKVGLWELKIIMDGGVNITSQQCLDEATDEILRSDDDLATQGVCSKHEVQRSGDTLTIDTTCVIKDKTLTTHVVITGSMDSAYTTTATTAAEGEAGKMSTTTTGKYLGACAADQKPGDVIVGSRKLNVLDVIKRGGFQQ